MSKEDKQETPTSSVVLPSDFDLSEADLLRLQKTYDPRLYLSPGNLRLVQKQPNTEPARSWREQDGVIYFSVTSNGLTGENWIKRLGGNSFCIEDHAKQVLRSPDFKPTSGVTTEIAILKSVFFGDGDRFTREIRAHATERGFTSPNTEIACLIREKFTNKDLGEMGLRWIVVMHEPIKDSVNRLDLLSVNCDSDCDDHWLSANDDRPCFRWLRNGGFAFVTSQASSQS